MKHISAACERVLPMLFWVLLMLAFDTPSVVILTVIAALLHESGHIAAMTIICRKGITLPRAVISGLRLKPERALSYTEELFVAAAGPLLNLLLFTFLILFSTRGGVYLYSFAIINLLTALSNLLPARGYDGYRIMYSTLALLSNAERSARFMHTISLFFSAFVVFLSLGLIMIFDSGYWIFVIFFISLIGELTKRQKHINRENN